MRIDLDENEALSMRLCVGDRLRDLRGGCSEIFDGEREALERIFWKIDSKIRNAANGAGRVREHDWDFSRGNGESRT